MIQLRGHHLLCVLGFQGLGYSTDFVKVTTAIQAQYLSTNEQHIRAVQQTDDTCQACPHHSGEFCHKDATADARMRSRDAAVLHRLGLTLNSEHSNLILRESIAKAYVFKSDANDSCHDCEWQSDCLWHQSLKD